METKTIVSNITHDDLVNLFSTAFSGDIFSASYPMKFYNENLKDENRDDCFEDKLALCLLNGKEITIHDYAAEEKDEFFGMWPHVWNEERQSMDYTISLSSIRSGLQIAIDGTFKANDDGEKAYARKCAHNLIGEDASFDMYEAQNLLQIIVFNEIVYG